MDEIKEVVEQQVPETPVEQPKPDVAAQNLAAMRKKLEAAEARAIEAERRYSQPQAQPQSSQAPQSEDEDYGDPEDYVPNKRLAQTTKKFSSKLSEADRKMQELEQKIAVFEAKAEISELKDFNDIVTEDNLKTLARLYPEDYEVMQTNGNLRAKSKAAYNMIKNYGIANTTPALKQAEAMKAVEKKIEQNKSKPGSSAQAAASSSSPLTKYGRYNEEGRLVLTDADRDQINKEMRRKITGAV